MLIYCAELLGTTTLPPIDFLKSPQPVEHVRHCSHVINPRQLVGSHFIVALLNEFHQQAVTAVAKAAARAVAEKGPLSDEDTFEQMNIPLMSWKLYNATKFIEVFLSMDNMRIEFVSLGGIEAIIRLAVLRNSEPLLCGLLNGKPLNQDSARELARAGPPHLFQHRAYLIEAVREASLLRHSSQSSLALISPLISLLRLKTPHAGNAVPITRQRNTHRFNMSLNLPNGPHQATDAERAPISALPPSRPPDFILNAWGFFDQPPPPPPRLNRGAIASADENESQRNEPVIQHPFPAQRALSRQSDIPEESLWAGNSSQHHVLRAVLVALYTLLVEITGHARFREHRFLLEASLPRDRQHHSGIMGSPTSTDSLASLTPKNSAIASQEAKSQFDNELLARELCALSTLQWLVSVLDRLMTKYGKEVHHVVHHLPLLFLFFVCFALHVLFALVANFLNRPGLACLSVGDFRRLIAIGLHVLPRRCVRLRPRRRSANRLGSWQGPLALKPRRGHSRALPRGSSS